MNKRVGPLDIWSNLAEIAASGVTAQQEARQNLGGVLTVSDVPVQSVAGRTGVIALSHVDITDWATALAGYAPLSSPHFTGTAQSDGTTNLGTGSANYVQIAGAAGNPTIAVVGTGTNGALLLQSQGHGSINIRSATGGIITQFVDGSAGTIGNFPIITAKVAGSPITIQTSDATAGLQFSGGPVQFGRTYTYSGLSSVANSALRGAFVINGNATDNVGTGINYFQFDDNMTISNDREFTHFGVFSRVNAQSSGPRIAFAAGINQTAKTQSFALGKSPMWQGVQFTATASFNEGGTAGINNGNGAIWAQINGVTLNAGATYFNGAVGTEYDVSIAAGANVIRNRPIQVVLLGSHQTRGSVSDTAIAIGAVSGAVSLTHGIEFGSNLDFAPFDAHSTYLYSELPHTSAAYGDLQGNFGIDWQQTQFVGGPLRSFNHIIDGVGTTQIGAGVIKSVSNGMAIDSTGSIVTGTPTVADGGSLWLDLNLMRDAYNGVYMVSSLASVDGTGRGPVATVTVICPSMIQSGSPPTNPVPMTGFGASDGIGCTLNLTWDQTQRTVALSPSGGPTTIGGSLARAGAQADQSADVVAMVNSGSHTIANSTSWCCLTAGGTITSYTLTMPAAPLDGHDLWISTGPQITKLTLPPNSGQTISEAPASMQANSTIHYRYRVATTSWLRLSKPTRPTYQLLYVAGASVGNGADTTEDALQTFTLPANTISATGDVIEIEAAGTFAASTDTKTMRVKFGAITFTNLVGNTAGNTTWWYRVRMIRTSSGVYRSLVNYMMNNQPVSPVTATPSQSETVDNVIAVTGQNSTNPVAGSITCAYFCVSFMPAAT